MSVAGTACLTLLLRVCAAVLRTQGVAAAGHTVVRVQGEGGATFIADVVALFGPVDGALAGDDADAVVFLRWYTSVAADGTLRHPVATGLEFVVRSHYYSVCTARSLLEPAAVVPNFGRVTGTQHDFAAAGVSKEARRAGATTHFVVPQH